MLEIRIDNPTIEALVHDWLQRVIGSTGASNAVPITKPTATTPKREPFPDKWRRKAEAFVAAHRQFTLSDITTEKRPQERTAFIKYLKELPSLDVQRVGPAYTFTPVKYVGGVKKLGAPKSPKAKPVTAGVSLKKYYGPESITDLMEEQLTL